MLVIINSRFLELIVITLQYVQLPHHFGVARRHRFMGCFQDGFLIKIRPLGFKKTLILEESLVAFGV